MMAVQPAISRLDRLCAALARDRRIALPRDVDPALADRLLDAAILDADDATLRTIAGDAVYLDGYAMRRLATWHWPDLRSVVRAARIEIARCVRDSEQLQQQRDAIELLLSPTQKRTTS